MLNPVSERKKERNKIYHIVDFEFREFLLTSLEHLYGLENWDLESSLMEMLYFDITDEFLLNILKAIFNDRKTMENFSCILPVSIAIMITLRGY